MSRPYVLRNDNIPGNGGEALQWDVESLFNEEKIEEAQQAWKSEGVCVLRMTVAVTRVRNEIGEEINDSRNCDYTALLQRVASGDAAEIWSRDGMVLPHEGSLDDAEHLGLVDIDTSGYLGQLLRDSEGEGHLDWAPWAHSRRALFKKKTGVWGLGRPTVEFVQATIREFSRILEPPEDEEVFEDDEFLVDMWSKEDGPWNPPQPPPKPCPICESIPCTCVHTPVPKKTPVARVVGRPSAGVIRVRRNPQCRDLTGSTIGVLLAIESKSKGNNFTKYREWDFRPSDVKSRSTDGCTVIGTDYRQSPKKRGGVLVRISIDDQNWKLDLEGFPIDRVIDVEVDEVAA